MYFFNYLEYNVNNERFPVEERVLSADEQNG